MKVDLSKLLTQSRGVFLHPSGDPVTNSRTMFYSIAIVDLHKKDPQRDHSVCALQAGGAHMGVMCCDHVCKYVGGCHHSGTGKRK
jgi:hypothetical protein